MESVFTVLNCGHNCSGYSSSLTLHKATNGGEKKVVAICLINAGDSVQKFCNENRIKLKMVTCVWITSLVPHSVSGLAGLILALSSLGVETLSVIAPPGVKGLLDVMIPFTNRKYPRLDVHEITKTDGKVLIKSIPFFVFEVIAVCHSINRGNALALAGSITTMPETTILASDACSAPTPPAIACVPYAQNYSIFPSVPELCADYAAAAVPLVLFIPLQSGGGVLAPSPPPPAPAPAPSPPPAPYSYRTIMTSGPAGLPWQPPLPPPPSPLASCHLQAFDEVKLLDFFNRLCKRNGFVGIFIGLTRCTSSIEFRQSQLNLFQLSRYNKAISIGVLPPVAAGVTAFSQLEAMDESDSDLDSDPETEAMRTMEEHVSAEWYAQLPRIWKKLKEEELESGTPVISALPLLSVNISTTVTPTALLSHEDGSDSNACSDTSDNIDTSDTSDSIDTSDNSDSSDSSDSSSSTSDCESESVSDGESDEANDERDSDGGSSDSSDGELIVKKEACNQGAENIDHDHDDNDDDDNSDVSGGEDSEDEDEDSSEDDSLSCLGRPFFLLRAASVDDPIHQLAQRCFAYEERENSLKCSQYRSTTGMASTETLLESSSTPNEMKAVKIKLQLKRKRSDVQSTSDVIPDVRWDVAPPPPIPPPSPLDGVFTFLGTGCATPSKHRSSSCIVFQLPTAPLPPPPPGHTRPDSGASAGARGERVSIIIDAGESCLSQLYQSYSGNISRMHLMLRSVAIIWISHHHLDHHGGLPLLLEELQRVHMTAGDSSPLRKVLVIAPTAVLLYQEYCACIAGYDDIVEFIYINQTCSNTSNGAYFITNSRIALRTNNLICNLESVPVKHCKDSYGLVLHCSTGEKVVYSGDCRPSESLICAGKDCHLLIHEATFDDSLAADAISKKHSTVSEALSVGHSMRAKFIVLTHFSQRYPKSIATGSEGGNSSTVSKNYVLAHDFLRFSFPSQVNHLRENLRFADALNEIVENSFLTDILH